MDTPTTDKVFAGSIPACYEQYLVPLLFAPYAADLARRLALRPPERLLEIAAGTGVVTRKLAEVLPASVSITATDLSQPMLDVAAAVPIARPVEWRQADAMQLPFEDEAFDAVVCQFGVMFFPDKAKAFAEVRRVLKPHGLFLFNVWDRIEENWLAHTVCDAVAALFPDDPPRFMVRTPHGYYDLAAIARDLLAGGFSATPAMHAVPQVSRADTARIAAMAFCLGTPQRGEIESRDPARLAEATEAAAAAIAARFGSGVVEAQLLAHVIEIER